MKRPKQHWEPYYLGKEKRTHKANWIRGLLVSGLVPTVLVLERVASAEEVFQAEQAWIADLRAKGVPLTNLTLGGEGTIGCQWSAEVRVKMGAPKLGKPRSPEVRAKMSASHLARERTPEELEHARALGLSWRGKTRSAETRAKMAAAKLGKPRPPEMVARIAAALRGRKMSPEAKEKISLAKLGKLKSPETRARMSEAKRRWWAERKAREAA
jgi:hypothetical protein